MQFGKVVLKQVDIPFKWISWYHWYCGSLNFISRVTNCKQKAFMFVSMCFLCSLVNGFRQSQHVAARQLASSIDDLLVPRWLHFQHTRRHFLLDEALVKHSQIPAPSQQFRKDNSIASWIHCWYQSDVVKLKHRNQHRPLINAGLHLLRLSC